MPAGRRFGLASAISVAFHAAVVLLVGLAAMGQPTATRTLIPIELEMASRAGTGEAVGGADRPGSRAAPQTEAALVQAIRRSSPSSSGGRAKRAPAPPRVLTAKGGREPAGESGAGRGPAGAGGQADIPAGPTYGAAVVGGPLPVYPKDALDLGLEGTVVVAVSVGPDGAVKAVAVERSSGQPLLDQAAVRAVKQAWTFSPAMENGRPTAAGSVTVAFRFSAGKVSRE
jgi:protein TonB